MYLGQPFDIDHQCCVSGCCNVSLKNHHLSNWLLLNYYTASSPKNPRMVITFVMSMVSPFLSLLRFFIFFTRIFKRIDKTVTTITADGTTIIQA